MTDLKYIEIVQVPTKSKAKKCPSCGSEWKITVREPCCRQVPDEDGVNHYYFGDFTDPWHGFSHLWAGEDGR